jgi:hypothetical protein
MSYYYAWRGGVLPSVSFRLKNFWDVNIEQYDTITIFGVTPTMGAFMNKVQKEAKMGAFVVCFRFPMKSLTPYWHEGELFIYSKDPKR